MSKNSSQKRYVISKRIYQFQIPLFLVSFIVGILIVEYFTAYAPFTSVKAELQNWASIIGSLAILYASILVTASSIRTVIRRKMSRREVLKSVVFLCSLAFFLIYGMSDPRLISGTKFLLVYNLTMGVMGSMVWVNANTWACWAGIHSLSRIRSIEALTVWFVTLLMLLGGMTGLVALWPRLNDIYIWIMMYGDPAARLAAVAAAGVGGIILGIRAIIGKEPGLVEVEIKGE